MRSWSDAVFYSSPLGEPIGAVRAGGHPAQVMRGPWIGVDGLAVTDVAWRQWVRATVLAVDGDTLTDPGADTCPAYSYALDGGRVVFRVGGGPWWPWLASYLAVLHARRRG